MCRFIGVHYDKSWQYIGTNKPLPLRLLIDKDCLCCRYIMLREYPLVCGMNIAAKVELGGALTTCQLGYSPNAHSPPHTGWTVAVEDSWMFVVWLELHGWHPSSQDRETAFACFSSITFSYAWFYCKTILHQTQLFDVLSFNGVASLLFST